MRDLIDRYLDGQLTEQEAEAFLHELQQNPELERELRAYEEILAEAARIEQPYLAPDFTDRVMARIHQVQRENATPRRNAGGRLWRPARVLALAASLLLVFSLGYFTARSQLGPGKLLTGGAANPGAVTNLGGAAHPDGATDQLAGLLPGETSSAIGAGLDGFRLVRLVYQPRQSEVARVTIAGTFNGWNPTATPMHREGEIWTALLLLPPDTYEYMFVENGQDWITDPLALQTRDDGFGRMNAVLDLNL
jgi:anti-sigma factor RsiW